MSWCQELVSGRSPVWQIAASLVELGLIVEDPPAELIEDFYICCIFVTLSFRKRIKVDLQPFFSHFLDKVEKPLSGFYC